MSEEKVSYSPANADLRQPSESQAGGPPLIVFVGLASLGLLALIVVIYLFAGDPNGVGTPGAAPAEGATAPAEGATAPTEGAAPTPEAAPMPEAAPTEGSAPAPEAAPTEGSAPMPEATPAEGATAENVIVSSNFETVPQGSGAIGTVILSQAPEGEGMQIQVEVQNIPAGAHAWHIHSASCSDLSAPIVVPFTATASSDGLAAPIEVSDPVMPVVASALIPADRLSQEQLDAGAYSLHIHQNAGVEHGPTIACANL